MMMAMAQQLKVKEVLDAIDSLIRSGMSQEDVENVPIYLGDDDELNGIHCGWYASVLDVDDPSGDSNYEIELINSRLGNFPLDSGVAILIG